MLWAAGTFVVMRLTRSFPLERPHLARGLALHSAFGIAVSIGLLCLEFLLNHAIEQLWPAAPRANALLGYIVYKFHVYFLIYWMILGATRAFDFQAKFRETELLASQLEARLAQAQLLALKSQLHPHFLFNTHHAIISLMLKPDTAGAVKMLTRLSDLLRITLQKSNDQFSALRDELDALELYLGIQRERYRDRLRVEMDIDSTTLTAEVPWLLLQPIVENALKHGIDSLPTGGVLRIHVWADRDQLKMSVNDNGPGPASDVAVAQSTGIGLRNTRERLARLYGDTQQLEIRNPPPGGTEVRITIPLRAFAPANSAPATTAHA
jgi:LytS/YehU family sensor histidine kinase